jgi:hypothetical protein
METREVNSLSVCVFLLIAFEAVGRFFMQFSRQVLPLKLTSMLQFLIPYFNHVKVAEDQTSDVIVKPLPVSLGL